MKHTKKCTRTMAQQFDIGYVHYQKDADDTKVSCVCVYVCVCVVRGCLYTSARALSLCMRTHTLVRAKECVCVYVCSRKRHSAYACAHACVHACVCVCVCVRAHVTVPSRVHACVHMCVCVCARAREGSRVMQKFAVRSGLIYKEQLEPSLAWSHDSPLHDRIPAECVTAHVLAVKNRHAYLREILKR